MDFLVARPELSTRRKRKGSAKESGKARTKAEVAELRKYTLFRRTFASVVIDEAHDFRTMNVAWEAASEIVDRASVRIAMTATPIVTGPLVSAVFN